MVEVREIGDFLRTDEDGFLVGESDAAKIVPPWRDVVDEVRRAYLEHLKDRVHSIYVRGSVSRGRAIEGVSDVDTLAVIRGDVDDVDLSWKRDFVQRMAEEYPFQTGIELDLVPYGWVTESDRARYTRFKIQAQCACIHGEDLGAVFPPSRPSVDIVLHAFQLRREVRDYLDSLPTLDDERVLRDHTEWIMKRIVRTGFEIVMEREGTYTRDLYPCWEAFSRHYPGHAAEMKTALEWAIAPTTDRDRIVAFFSEFAPWFLGEVERVYPRPQKSVWARWAGRARWMARRWAGR